MIDWTPELEAKLVALRDSGKTFEFVGMKIGTTGKSAASRYNALQNRNPKSTKYIPTRKCLGCRKEFQPSHKGQYLHEKCKRADESGMMDCSVWSPRMAAR